MNLVLITSIIKTPNTPLSYTNTRSIYTWDERFEQTKQTIQTIQEKIPNPTILLVECSELDPHQSEYFHTHCHYVINLFDTSIEQCHSESKALGEATMTMAAIEFIQNNHISFDSFFKISGRYYLSESFDYSFYNIPFNVVKHIDEKNINTCLYKLDKSSVFDYYHHLKSIMQSLYDCIGYETQFCDFIQQCTNVQYIETLGVKGLVSVANGLIVS